MKRKLFTAGALLATALLWTSAANALLITINGGGIADLPAHVYDAS